MEKIKLLRDIVHGKSTMIFLQFAKMQTNSAQLQWQETENLRIKFWKKCDEVWIALHSAFITVYDVEWELNAYLIGLKTLMKFEYNQQNHEADEPIYCSINAGTLWPTKKIK